jgi:trimethylamine--corrinoid protein Co-methyltransferase
MLGFEKPSSMPSFRVLAEDALEAIHWSSLEILSRTGMKVAFGKKILKMLEENGCSVDFDKETVRFPSHIVEECVRKTSKSHLICGRSPKYDYKLDGRHVFFIPDTETTNTIDLDTGVWKPSTREDLENLTRVVDALDIYASGSHMTTCLDKPVHVRCLHDYAAALNSTEKPYNDLSIYPQELAPYIVDYVLEMAKAVAGDEESLRKRPLGNGEFCVTSPLEVDGRMVEAALKLATFGFPCSVTSLPLSGATAPVTLAGALTLTNAEILAGISIIQLARPGTPVTPLYIPGVLDMKFSGRWAAGSPEEGLLAAGCVEIARHYGFRAVVFGVNTSAKVPGPQACYEKVASGVMPVLAGADIVYGCGSLDGGIAASCVELVIDEEICKALLNLAQGIEVTDETIALDVIERVGPGGHYLTEKHTLKHFKNEHFFPKLANRDNYEVWKEKGGKSLVDAATERAGKILKEHWPTPLDKDVQRRIADVLKRAETELGKRLG